ncbi:MAG: DUF1292 domain-containing protein [Oscillibacter sp.]
MSEEFGPTFVTVTDEDGKEIELELLFPIEYNGHEYRVFLPAEVEGEEISEEDEGFIILKIVEEGGEQLLSTCDDEDEESAVYDLAMEELFDEDEDDEE